MRLALLVVICFALTGCAFGPAAAPSPETGQAITGIVHGGQQPITSAHVYLFAANTTGYGGSGIAASSANASLSLLTTGDGSDATGTYVLTNSNGNFNISAGQYSCATGQQVYIYALGGNPGAGTNGSAAGLAILGACPDSGNFLAADPTVTVNEVTTIAAAYAFAGFASNATHISSSGTTLAQTGIANAFASAANLVSLATGTALTTTPPGNGTVPTTTINTLANILAACINSNGSTAAMTPCGTLFSNATLDGTTTGTQPNDTASAALNIAHFPANNIAALYGLQTAAASPFPTSLSTQPHDFTVGLTFTGGGLNQPFRIAVDGTGNVWTANDVTGGGISKFASNGSALSGSTPYTAGGLTTTYGLAIDMLGNAWVTSYLNNAIIELSNNGTVLSGSSGYTSGGLNGPYGIAIDGSNHVWIANNGTNSLTELASNGSPISGANGYSSNGLFQPYGIAIDGAGSAWVTNVGISRLAKISATGLTLSGAGGYSGGGLNSPNQIALDNMGNSWIVNAAGIGITEFAPSGVAISASTGFYIGINRPEGIAIDGAGNAWIANLGNNSTAELSTTGSALSGTGGYMGGGMNWPYAIAIDGSGNAWVVNLRGNTLTELVGIAVPVITPICAGLPTTPTTDGSSLLGTRP